MWNTKMLVCLAAVWLVIAGNGCVESAFLQRENYPKEGKNYPEEGGAKSARAYTCVPANACDSSITNKDVLNIKLTRTFFSPSCPTGQVVCRTSSATPECGLRSVNSSGENGPSAFGAYPWQAYIVNRTGYTGSGVLIDRYHVLTVAHKVYSNVRKTFDLQVYLGVWNPTDFASAYRFIISKIIVHPNFSSDTLRNDIAILRLASPAPLGVLSNLGTACLPDRAASYIGRNCSVSGWGQSFFGANDASNGPQRQITVPIVDYATCRTSMSKPDILGDNVDRYLDPVGDICAGGQVQQDACTQDGGSPLVCQDTSNGRFYVAGLVAWGVKCGMSGVYGVYVNVSSYRTWIDQVAST